MYKKIIISLFLCSVLIVIYAFADALNNTDLEQEKSNIISLIQQANYAEAQVQTQELIASFPGHPDLPETLYLIAEQYHWSGKLDQTKDLHQQIIQSFSGSPYADKAQLAYSRTEVLSLIASNKFEQAQEALDKLVADFSGNPDLPEALFWIAERYKWSGRHERAKSIHQQVIQNHPDSSWAGKAKLGISMTDVLSLIESGKYSQSEEALDKLVADFSGHPDLPEVLYRIADGYKWSGGYQQAKDVFQQVIQNYPDSSRVGDAKLGISMTDVLSLIMSRNYSQAEEALDKLVADFSGHPDLPETLYSIADGYKWSGGYEKAKSVFQQVIQNYPDSSRVGDAKLGISMTDVLSLIASGNYSQAEEALDKLVTDFSGHPDLPEILNRIAEGYEWSGGYEQAESVYQQVIQNHPDSSSAGKAELGISMTDVLSLIMSGNYSQAEEALDKLVADFSGHPDLPEVLYRIAEGYKWSGGYEQEESVYQQVIDHFPESPQAQIAKINLERMNIISLIESGDDVGALDGIDTLIADFNNYPDLQMAVSLIADSYYNKGLRLQNEGLNDQAAENYRKSITIHEIVIQQLPPSGLTSRSYYFTGVLYSEYLQEYQKAIKYFQDVVENWPEYQFVCDAQYFIGFYYEKLRDSGDIPQSEANPKIEQAYQAVVERYPDSEPVPYVAIKLGQINFKKEQWSQAAKYLEIFLEKHPEQLMLVVLPLGQSYEKIGESEKAVELYNIFIENSFQADSRIIETVKTRLKTLEGQDK